MNKQNEILEIKMDMARAESENLNSWNLNSLSAQMCKMELKGKGSAYGSALEQRTF